MFCEGCGAEMQIGSRVCGKCGRELVGYAEVKRDRLARHVQLLGIFWITYSVLQALGALAVILVAHALVPHLENLRTLEFIPHLLVVVGGFLVVKSVVGVVAGLGLTHRAPWARILSIVLGFLALLNVPFGTALGIYTIWALLPPGADVEYRALSQQA